MLFEGAANIINIIDDKLYYINDKKQLIEFDLNTHEEDVYMNTLILYAYLNDNYIYYINLKDDTLYRKDRFNDDGVQVIKEQINFFQVKDDEIYYTTIGGKGINVYNQKSKLKDTILNEIDVYAFNVFNDTICFTAYDDTLHKICSYYYKSNNIYRIDGN